MAAHTTTRTRLKKELFKKEEEPEKIEEKTTSEQKQQEVPEEKEEEKEESLDEAKEVENRGELKKNLLWAGLLIIYVAILASGGYFMYQLGFNKGIEAAKKQAEKIEVKEAAPTPTPAPAVDKTKYSIKVLNGSNIAGEAAKAKELLEAEGFTVISVGNASSQDNIDTTIAAKDDVDSEFISLLKETLGKTYTLGEVETIASNETADVVITLGGVK